MHCTIKYLLLQTIYIYSTRLSNSERFSLRRCNDVGVLLVATYHLKVVLRRRLELFHALLLLIVLIRTSLNAYSSLEVH